MSVQEGSNKEISVKTSALVESFYSTHTAVEWRRLVKNAYNHLEFETSVHFIQKYLPPGGLVLDAGGGPGRYTIWLAQQGNDVVLLDLTQANLDMARRRIKRAGVQSRVKEITRGTIVDLSRFADRTFAAVLCTGGPLSHVLDPGDREQAISELIRVAKPGAPVFVSVMSRLSVMILELREFQHEFEMPLFKSMRETGDYFGGSGFTACHFFLPEELRLAFTRPGLDILEMVGLEGISSNHPKSLNQLAHNPVRYASWMETHYQTCTHPSIVGISEHMLIINRKK